MALQLHTSLGDIKIEIFCEAVPKTATNFMALCASGQYDNTPIHRIIPNFIMQTGAPPSDPKSKTSVSIWGGFFEDEIRPSLKHNARGIVSMANKGPDTNGSQFFICFEKQPTLDGKNTVFGKVIDGWSTLDSIEKAEVDGKGRPKGEKVMVEKVTIHANPLAG